MNEPRQRWRIVFARNEEARYLSHLDAVHLWERAFRRGNVPVATSGGFTPRPRLIFAAPLPLGMLAEHDLADLYLSERMTRHDLRERLGLGMPRGYELVDLYDEWLGAPALATQLVAADYRLSLIGADGADLARAAGALLAAGRLNRARRREKKVTTYDLRPLLCQLEARGGGEAAPNDSVVWMRLRNSQELGIGRADEVVAALAAELGMKVQSLGDEPDVAPPPVDDATARGILEMIHPVRERLWLAGEVEVQTCGSLRSAAESALAAVVDPPARRPDHAPTAPDDASDAFDVEGLAP